MHIELFYYIVVLIVVISAGIIGFNLMLKPLSGIWTFIVTMFSMVFTLGWVVAGLTGLGPTIETTVPATNTRVGDEIMIQSKYKTIVVDNIGFVDKKLEVTQYETYNVLGILIHQTYTVSTTTLQEKEP